jgi:hypothetical protein
MTPFTPVSFRPIWRTSFLLRDPRARRVVGSARSLRTELEMGALELPLKAGGTVPQFLRSDYVDQMLRRAEWKYVPARYDGKLDLFRGGGLWDNDPEMGWDGLASRIEHHTIGQIRTSVRREIMDEPLVGLLAEALTAALDEAEHDGTEEKNTALVGL